LLPSLVSVQIKFQEALSSPLMRFEMALINWGYCKLVR
jgi:hypothetical protein